MLKLLYLILFYFIYRITDLVLLVVMIIQAGLSIFTGEPSDSIKLFGRSLGAYLAQISLFLSYASEEKPFPFSDWPDAKLNMTEQSLAVDGTSISETQSSSAPIEPETK